MNKKTSLLLPHRLALIWVFVLGIFAAAVAAPEDFYRAHFQPGVSMGMSQEELAKARPAARNMDMSGFDRPAPAKPPGAPVQMAEIRRGRDGASVSSYRFKAGKLGAVVEATKTATKTTVVPIEQSQAAVSKLTDELKANFVLKGQEQILRTGGIDGAGLLTAQLWEDKAKGLNLYFVATNQGIEIVIFDPKAFAKGDFFSAPEGLENLKAEMEKIRRQLGDRADPPMPLIDLLAKPAAEKK
jgi:hypothetical protein